MNYLTALCELFEMNRSAEHAQPMKKYMKNQFDFLGIKRPLRNELQKQFIKQYGLPKLEEVNEVITTLWNKPEREYQYFALDLLDKLKNKLPENTILLYKEIITTKSWWDTVDLIASKLVGNHIKKFSNHSSTIDSWSTDKNMWLRRTALLHQLKYKNETNTFTLTKHIESNMGSKEFFINKAIGWILREYGKVNPDYVISFVEEHPKLASLSKKEALRIILKK